MARRRRVNRADRERRERKYRLQANVTRFIPDSDSDFAHMARQFANCVKRGRERFGVSVEQSEKLAAAVEAYRVALSKTMQACSAGPMATRIKNTARKNAEAIVRAVGKTLRGCEAVTAVDRLSLNMHERTAKPKAVVCPQVAPLLKFIGNTENGRHILEYSNDFDHASSAKPRGAARLELFVELVPPPQLLEGMRRDIAMYDPTVGGQVPTHPAQWSGGRLWYLGSFTTSRFEVEFPYLNDGTPALVCYWGRWADARGGVGPFSKTCVAKVEGSAFALPEPVYLGRAPRKLTSGVSRKVEPRAFPMLEACGSTAAFAMAAPRQLEAA